MSFLFIFYMYISQIPKFKDQSYYVFTTKGASLRSQKEKIISIPREKERERSMLHLTLVSKRMTFKKGEEKEAAGGGE